MAEATVIGEIHDGITQGQKDVQVRNCSADSAPEHGLAPELASRNGLADSGAECELS